MEFQKRFFDNLSKIYANIDNYRPDVTLVSIEDGTKRKCHSIILSASSEYFSNVFNWDTSSPPPAELEVHQGIAGETIDIVIKYIYSGEINLDLDKVNDLLVAANYFQILEIVDLCTSFITQNLEVSTCIDILLFSWQLDLVKLTEKVTCFVAQNFSGILGDDSLREKGVALPMKLLITLLKSNDLVFRDLKTRLPTRPADREQLLLDFIVQCGEKLNLEVGDITSLLECVKWPMLNIFNRQDYILKNISPRLKNGEMESKLKEFYNVKDSEWYISYGAHSAATENDKRMYGTRAYSCSELVSLDSMADKDEITREIAGGNRATITPKQFEYIAAENEYIKKLVVITRLWDNKTIVAGITLELASGDNIVRHHAGITADNGADVHNIELKDGEHITGVSGTSGWLVDSLTFESSMGPPEMCEKRTFGPFGGEGGTKNNLMETLTKYREEGQIFVPFKWKKSVAHPGPHARIPLDSLLVGITGKEVTTADHLAITHLRFVFRAMLPTSDFLIRSDKKCERRLPVRYTKRPPSADSYDSYGDYDDGDYDGYDEDDYDDYDGYDYDHDYDDYDYDYDEEDAF